MLHSSCRRDDPRGNNEYSSSLLILSYASSRATLSVTALNIPKVDGVEHWLHFLATVTGVRIWLVASKFQPSSKTVERSSPAGRPRYTSASAKGIVVYAFDNNTIVRWRKDSINVDTKVVSTAAPTSMREKSTCRARLKRASARE